VAEINKNISLVTKNILLLLLIIHQTHT